MDEIERAQSEDPKEGSIVLRWYHYTLILAIAAGLIIIPFAIFFRVDLTKTIYIGGFGSSARTGKPKPEPAGERILRAMLP